MTTLPPRLNPKNRKLHIEWLYARSQALARAQSHYLLLLLLVAAYSVVVHFSAAATAPVNVLGLDVPKALVEAGAVSILSLVTLGFFGAAQATEMTYTELGQQLEEPELWKLIHVVDQHPNLLDFLEFSTYRRGGKVWWPTVIGWFILYPLPLVAALGWAVLLWWSGLHSCPYPWPWLLYVHYVNAAALAIVLIRLLPFLQRHVEGIVAALKRPKPAPRQP